MAASPDWAARVRSQARWRHEEEHHFGARPRAWTRMGDPHQPHARVWPGRRGAPFGPSLLAVLALLVPLAPSVFMCAPPTVYFVPTTLTRRQCTRCVPHRFLLFLGGAWVVGLLGARSGVRCGAGVAGRTRRRVWSAAAGVRWSCVAGATWSHQPPVRATGQPTGHAEGPSGTRRVVLLVLGPKRGETGTRSLGWSNGG